jgi:energy-coupling factor transporter ATP-binding protein EcfA2
MAFTFEIYLTKKFISNREWLELINSLANYNGYLRRWKIIITNENNIIRYFISTKYNLPSTINNLNSFLLKHSSDITIPKFKYKWFSFTQFDSVIDLINDCEIKNKGNLIYLEISFLKLQEDKLLSRLDYYINKNGIVKKYNVLFSIPANVLSIDFDGNKRYFYKSCPKYLDISKILHLLNRDSNNALLSIDTFPYLQDNYYLNQNSFSFDKHSIIIGSSGCGKSKFICSLINNIYKSSNTKYKIVVIDPHASLEDDIGGIGKVVDFKSSIDSIDLFINSVDDVVSSTELLLDLFKSLIADQYNSKLERVLRHSIHLLLTNKSFNFRNLRKLILDLEYRNELLKDLKDVLPVSVIDFFLSDFNDLKTKSYGDAISPIIGFIDEMEMIPVFNLEHNMDNLTQTIKNNFLTIFSLDRTRLGDKVTKTISGLIMQQLLGIIQNHEMDEHIIFIIDEVAVVENPILSRYLSESRKYNLSLVLAGQYFSQISDGLKNSIFANVINYFIFRVSRLDAGVLVDNFNMKIQSDDSREAKMKVLTELNNRECIARVDTNGILLPAFKGKTLDYISIPRIKSDNIIEVSKSNNPKINNKTNFSLSSNINLKDILISNSTSKKVV